MESMNFTISGKAPIKQVADCIIAGVFEGGRLSPTANAIDVASGKYLSRILKRGDIDGAIGETLLIHDIPQVRAGRTLLVGCGRRQALSAMDYRKILECSLNKLKTSSVGKVIFCLHELDLEVKDTVAKDAYWKTRYLVEISQRVFYRFDQFKSKKSGASRRKPVQFIITINASSDTTKAKQAVQHGNGLAAGIKLTRDLANLPANVCNPVYLSAQARILAKSESALKIKVINPGTMKNMGMNSLLSVAQGSQHPAQLIVIEYNGGKTGQRPVVLVGKGVTFDTGGISLKPAAAMDEMKYDMCGAASVLGTLLAVSRIALPINVVGIVPAVENMPGGKATRPGDIYKSMSGQTIEVLNTDAEGRLILCDALSYSERYKPASVVDIATLTGACVVALGKHASGLMSNHDPLAKALLSAGEKTGDRAWRLPIWDEYQEQINSPFADMANVGGRDAGAITAACFLARFTRKFYWAHLDIAGTAWLSGKNKGATGRPVPLLVQYLIDCVGK